MLHDYKFWPLVARVDNVFGDRKPVCSCVGMRYPSDFIAGVWEWRLEAVAGGTRVVYELGRVRPRTVGGVVGAVAAARQTAF